MPCDLNELFNGWHYRYFWHSDDRVPQLIAFSFRANYIITVSLVIELFSAVIGCVLVLFDVETASMILTSFSLVRVFLLCLNNYLIAGPSKMTHLLFMRWFKMDLLLCSLLGTCVDCSAHSQSPGATIAMAYLTLEGGTSPWRVAQVRRRFFTDYSNQL